MKLYLKYLNLHLRSQLQHRQSFIMITLAQALFAASSFLSIMLLMDADREFMNFNRYEVLLAGSIINLCFSSAECFGRGFDQFGEMLQQGRFDQIIIRPIGEIAQILMSTVDFTRFGRFIVALIIFLVSLSQVQAHSTYLFLFIIISGSIVYICLFIIYGSICFYTTQNLEIFNILTDGTKEFGKVPFSFYGSSILKFLTFVLPLALIQYYPLLFVLNKSDHVLYALTPLLALLFIFPTMLCWRKARRYYRSTGS